MRLNKKATSTLVTHEGATAKPISPYLELRRTVLASLLWEDTFYESGQSVADRVKALIAKIPAEKVAALAIEARDNMYLRHMPLLLVRELARVKGNGTLVANTLEHVIQRPDELTEYLAIYWNGAKEGETLSAGSKRGLAKAVKKFNAYSLGKYNRDGQIKLRDVLRIVRPKPADTEQGQTFGQLVKGTLAAPDTWEVALSGGADKKATFERLLSEQKLGGLAFLRNLRNMIGAGVDKDLIRQRFAGNFDKVLPFRFIAAAKYAPQFISELDTAMLRAASAAEKLTGDTVLLVDVSGSMMGQLSAKSDLHRVDAAAALAALLREICQNVQIITFDNSTREVPAFRGLALAKAITDRTGGGTSLGAAVTYANKLGYTRLIVLTDEQSADRVPDPKTDKAYMVNVAAYKNGVGYGPWTHIDGWSERIVDYIREFESASQG